MKVISYKSELLEEVSILKKNQKVTGFVPTMGALHQGHISLIKCCNKECDYTIVSIFVNPTQFNDPNDYKKYPRILDTDLELLKKVKVDILFTPAQEEMYTEQDNRDFDLGELDKVMEGAHRPGHFRGVCLIVSKLFEMVQPTKAYFGEKDFQQVAVIKHLTRLMNYPVEIIPCPIIRENDGLAMSSRNMLLTKDHRQNAPLIAKTLFEATEKSKTQSVQETKDWVVRTINDNPFLQVEYFEIVDETSLKAISNWDNTSNKRGCIAVFAGNVRLIDNIRFNS